ATVLLKEAYGLLFMLEGPNDPSFSVCLNNLAVMYSRRGEWDTAEKCLRTAIELTTTVSGAGGREARPGLLAGFQASLGSVLGARCRYEEAELILRSALDSLRDTGVQHPSYAVGLVNLAEVLAATGRQGEALPLLLEAVDLNTGRILDVF